MKTPLISRYDFDVPPNMLEEYITNLIGQLKKNTKEKVDEEYLKTTYRPDAVRNLKWHFIFNKLLKKYEIEAPEEEINARIEELAGQQNMEKEKALMLLRSNKNKDRIADQIIEEKNAYTAGGCRGDNR